MIDIDFYSRVTINVKETNTDTIHHVSCYVLDDFKNNLLTDYELLDDYDIKKHQYKYNKEADTPENATRLKKQVKNWMHAKDNMIFFWELCILLNKFYLLFFNLSLMTESAFTDKYK